MYLHCTLASCLAVLGRSTSKRCLHPSSGYVRCMGMSLRTGRGCYSVVLVSVASSGIVIIVSDIHEGSLQLDLQV